MRRCGIAPTPLGPLLLSTDDASRALSRVDYIGQDDARRWPPAAESPLLRRVAAQLSEYFSGRRRRFELPLSPLGTAFQRAVWREIAETGFGRTRSYMDIARALGRATGARAVGQAVGRNPLSIIVPCHRIVGSDGRLVGYGGGLEIKRRLLALESGAGQPG